MIRTKGFLHITISVTDLDRAMEFYRDVIGCEPVNENPIMRFMRSGDDLFVLAQTGRHVRPNPEAKPDAWTTLFHHAFIIDADDFDDAKRQLEAKGIEYADCTRHGHPTFPGRRHLYFYDPDG